MARSTETAEKLKTLDRRRLELAAEIDEAKARLPAHSVKPAQMMPLLELEDEFDDLLERIKALKQVSAPR